MNDLNDLKYARKDAGEFSILTALTQRSLKKPFTAVIVTKDEGARDLYKDAYAGKLKKHCEAILKTRRKNPRTNNMKDEEVMPYDLMGMMGKNPHLPSAYVLSERGFADLLLGLQAQTDGVFSKKMVGGKLNRIKYPDSYEKLQLLHKANAEIAVQFGGKEDTIVT